MRIKGHTDSGLPAEIAFLRHYGVAGTRLLPITRAAERLALLPTDTLLATGLVSATLYYRCLALHLGVPFVGGPAALVLPPDPAKALRDGVVRLQGNYRSHLLVAPRGPLITVMLEGRRQNRAMTGVAFTTPAHLAALVRHQASTQIAEKASFALLESDADLSAKTAVDAIWSWQGACATALPIAATLVAPRMAWAIFGGVFFAAIAGRLLATAHRESRPVALAQPPDATLPVYSVIVPLYREAAMIPDLIGRLDRLDYPAAKLQIVIMLEADDHTTRHALNALCLSPVYEIIVAPDGAPRTKPRALNVALPFLRGTIVTIFDAEDAPDVDQLRKAAARFHQEPHLACLQARLAIDNAQDGLLPRLFAIEYAALYDCLNVGIAALGLPLALGGTSNHFRTHILRRLGGWDAWNVAEDADLGFRLARFGHCIKMLDSTTFEQAPVGLGTWFTQRRRWTKGWMQTALVLARRPRRTAVEFGPAKTCALVLMITSLVLGPLLLPIFLGLVLCHFYREGWPHPDDPVALIETTLWMSVLFIGLATPLWCGFAGIRARKLKRCLVALPLVVPYQLLVSAAAWGGFYDLLIKPYHWHKTTHRPEAGRRPARRDSLFRFYKKSAETGAFKTHR